MLIKYFIKQCTQIQNKEKCNLTLKFLMICLKWWFFLFVLSHFNRNPRKKTLSDFWRWFEFGCCSGCLYCFAVSSVLSQSGSNFISEGGRSFHGVTICGELILGNVYTFLVFLRYSKNCQCYCISSHNTIYFWSSTNKTSWRMKFQIFVTESNLEFHSNRIWSFEFRIVELKNRIVKFRMNS